MQDHIRARYARIDQLEAKYAKKMLRVLLRQVEQCVELVKAGASAELVVAHINPTPIKILLSELYLKTIQQEAKAEYSRLINLENKGLLPVSDWLRRAKNFVQTQTAATIKGINDTTKRQVKKVLKESLEAGNSIQETVRNLRDRVGSFSRKRAVTISRTELVAASNYGSYAGALSTGLKLDKQWLATSDGRTRDTHAAIDGQRVDLNDLFNVGGERAEFPGDPSLSAAERCRCRCVVTFKKKPLAQQAELGL